MTPRPTRLAPDDRDLVVKAFARSMSVMHAALARVFTPAPVVLGDVAPIGTEAAAPEWLREQDLFGVTFDLRGPLHGRMLLLAEAGAGLRAASAMLGEGPTSLDSEATAALMELGNIASSSFLNGLAAATGMQLLPSVPMVSTDPAEELARAVEEGGGLAFASQYDVDLPGGAARALFVVAPASGSFPVLTIALRSRARR